MADDNKGNELGTKAVEAFVRRLYSLAGTTPTRRVRGDIQPSVEARPAFPQDHLVFGELIVGLAVTTTAVAGQFGLAEIGAFVDYDFVLRRVCVTGDSYTVRIGDSTVWGTAFSTTFRCLDNGYQPLLGGPIVPVNNVGVATLAGPGGQSIMFGTNGGLIFEGSIILRAGTLGRIAIVGSTANTAFNVSMVGIMIPTSTSRT